MRTTIVKSGDLSAKKGLRAKDYVPPAPKRKKPKALPRYQVTVNVTYGSSAEAENMKHVLEENVRRCIANGGLLFDADAPAGAVEVKAYRISVNKGE